MSVKGLIINLATLPSSENSTTNASGNEIKFMDDSSSSDESIEDALNRADQESDGYLKSPAVIGYQRVSFKHEPVYAYINPTSMPEDNSEIVHYKPSSVLRPNTNSNENHNKRNSLELVNEENETSDRVAKKECESSPKINGKPKMANGQESSKNGFLQLLRNDEDYNIIDTIYHQPPKAADRNAANRLAKRLFNLDGFKITDVSKHLSKRNDFSQLVGEEFASFFDFTDQPLDVSLKQFLLRFTLLGETQERERILHHFSKRYLQCNPDSYCSEDSCHTLVCAIMLLNMDLHGQHILRRMTVQDFQTNLANMNGGKDFDEEELVNLYNSIKNDPIRWPQPDGGVIGLVSLYCNPQMNGQSQASLSHSGVNMTPTDQVNNLSGSNYNSQSNGQLKPSQQQQQHSSSPSSVQQPFHHGSNSNTSIGSVNGSSNAIPNSLWNNIPTSLTQPLTSNNEKTRKLFSEAGQSPCLDIPGEVNAKEYMRGFLARKWIKDSSGKKPLIGKRSWRLYFGRLKDLVLYLYKDGTSATQAARAEEVYFNQLQSYLQAVYIYQHYQQKNKTKTSNGDTAQCNENQKCDNNNNDTTKAQTPLENGSDKCDINDQNGDEKHPIGLPTSVKADNGYHQSPSETNGDVKASIMLPKSAEALQNGKLDHCENEVDAMKPPVMPSPPNILTPEAVIRISHAIAVKVDDYKKKVNVFKLTTKEGTEYLFQVNDAKELDLWIDKLNFVAALLSAAPMASSIDNKGDFHKPLLPSSYTKLNMREQLEEYQKRIIELDREYSDYLTTSPYSSMMNNSQNEPNESDDKDLTSNGKMSSKQRRKAAAKESDNRPTRSQSIKSSLPGNQAGSNSSIASALSIASSSLSKKSIRRKGSLNWPTSQSSIAAAAKAAHEERISYYKSELFRYRTYARLLESELVRLHHFHVQQQQQTAMFLMRQSYYNLNAGFTPSPQRYLMTNGSTQNPLNQNSNNNFSQTNSPIAVNPFSNDPKQQTNSDSDPTSKQQNQKMLATNNKLLLRKNARQSWRQYNAAFNHQIRNQQRQSPHHPIVNSPSVNSSHPEESSILNSPPDSPESDEDSKYFTSEEKESRPLYEIV